jgi:hypothetical protein
VHGGGGWATQDSAHTVPATADTCTAQHKVSGQQECFRLAGQYLSALGSPQWCCPGSCSAPLQRQSNLQLTSFLSFSPNQAAVVPRTRQSSPAQHVHDCILKTVVPAMVCCLSWMQLPCILQLSARQHNATLHAHYHAPARASQPQHLLQPLAWALNSTCKQLYSPGGASPKQLPAPRRSLTAARLAAPAS